ncbi:MAG: OmpA family protein [Candidatus Cloacimonetes bacterium]|nr:OmpA family protein [Candidatus Cloacimonadota bacterium]
MKKTAFLMLLLGLAVLASGQISSPGSRYAQEGLEYYQRGDYDRAIREFLKADDSANGRNPEYHYWLGRLHIAVADTSSAMRWFERYQDSQDTAYQTQVDNYLRIVQRQARIFSRVNLRPLPDYVNSRNSDYGAVLDPEEKYLYFTSLRPARKNKENIWRTEIFRSGFGQPELVEELSTDKNEAFGCFSAEPQGAWIFGNYEANKRDGDIYFVPRTDKWFQPQNISQLNSSQVETHPMVFRDRLLFFASSRDGGYGGTDIYVSEKIGGIWTQPQNLGPMINTAENEQTPFLDWDGRTLYFSSRGHPGFGGYDLFKAYRAGTNWQEWSLPENLGLPVNSTRNDRYFYHARGSNEGYLSSDRQVSGFEKIYQLNFALTLPASYLVQEEDGSVRSVDIVTYVPPARKPADEESIFARIDESLETIKQGIPGPDFVPAPLGREPQAFEPIAELTPPSLIRIAGSVRDQYGEPVITEVQIQSETEGQRNLEIFNTNSLGNFLGTLPSAPLYIAVINAKDYLVHSEELSPGKGSSELRLDVELQKLEKKAQLSLADILFAAESAELDPKAISELDLVVMTLLTNPDLKVKLSGHAWETGSDDFNKQLSERRAKSVADYLIDKGIPKKRISWKAYGNSRTLDPLSVPSALSKSRRVEIMLQK